MATIQRNRHVPSAVFAGAPDVKPTTSLQCPRCPRRIVVHTDRVPRRCPNCGTRIVDAIE